MHAALLTAGFSGYIAEHPILLLSLALSLETLDGTVFPDGLKDMVKYVVDTMCYAHLHKKKPQLYLELEAVLLKPDVHRVYSHRFFTYLSCSKTDAATALTDAT